MLSSLGSLSPPCGSWRDLGIKKFLENTFIPGVHCCVIYTHAPFTLKASQALLLSLAVDLPEVMISLRPQPIPNSRNWFQAGSKGLPWL